MSRYLFLSLVTLVLNNVPPIVWLLIDFVIDIFRFWIFKSIFFPFRRSPIRALKNELQSISKYNDWRANVLKIDKLSGSDIWRQKFNSKKYDFLLISERLKMLREARCNGDTQAIMSFCRSGLIRNFGGIAHRDLFNRSYAGTKILIEDYVQEVLDCLNYLNEVDVNKSLVFSNQLKLDFFHDARQSFGCTALILQGGSLFGLCHLGVVKALYFKGLLPRIISGNAVGSAVGSLVCTLPDEELIPILLSITDFLGDIDRLNNDIDERYGSVIENVIKKGYSQDILIFMKFVRDTIGDTTFEEAFLKTSRILNIVVHPNNSAVPNLLNYVTTPNVIIWTAIYASTGSGVLSDNISLYVKDLNNEIVPRNPDLDITYATPQEANINSDLTIESPYTRLTELFNVNHFVVSLARPYLAPLIVNDVTHSNSWKPKRIIRNLLALELQHRVEILNKFGLLSRHIKSLAVDEKTPRTSREITIVPELRYLLRDFGRVFDVHRSFENIPYWVLVGEKSVWSLFPLLWTRCAIEFALDDLYDAHKKSKTSTGEH